MVTRVIEAAETDKITDFASLSDSFEASVKVTGQAAEIHSKADNDLINAIQQGIAHIYNRISDIDEDGTQLRVSIKIENEVIK